MFYLNPYVILVLSFIIIWCLLNYKFAFCLSGLALILVGLAGDALLSGTGEVYDQVPVSEKYEGSRKLRKRFKMFKSWNPFRRKQEKSKENVSLFHSKADRVNKSEDILPSPHGPQGSTPRLARQHRSFIVNQTHDSSVFNRSVLNASGPLLSTPLLPRVKRAVGANEIFSPGLSPSVRSGNRSITRSSTFHYAPNHPTISTPGTLPAVRLRKTHQRSFLDSNNCFVHSPNTVKIAPPDPSVILSPRVMPLREHKSDNKKPIDTQAVVCALRQRRKRSLVQTEEHFIDESDLQAKRRRQDSSQSTASSSSLPPMPENLPDLSNTNFMMQLDPISMKRPSAPSRDPIDLSEMEREGPAKRARGDNKNNPILSSLSSSKRALNNSLTSQRDSLKRKPLRYRSDSEDSANQSMISSDLSRSEQVSVEISMTGKEEHFTQLHDRSEFSTAQDRNKSLNLPSSSTPTKLPLMDGISKSTRRRQRSLYPGLNTSFQKVPVANVVASVEDYVQDRILEKQRIHDMLEDVELAHREKQNKGQDKTSSSESVAVSAPTTTTAVSLAVSSTPSISSHLSTSTTTSTSQPTAVSSTTMSTSAVSQPTFTFKPIFPSTTSSQVSAASATASTPATTTTSHTSGFSLSVPPSDSTSSQSAGKAPPPYSSSAPLTNLPASQSATIPTFSQALSSAAMSTGAMSSAALSGAALSGAALSSAALSTGVMVSGGLQTNTIHGGLSSTVQSNPTSLSSYLSPTSTHSALPASSLMGGTLSMSAPHGLLTSSIMGGQSGLLSTSAAGGLSSTSVQSGLMTSVLGGVSSAPSYVTPSQAGNLGSVQSGLMTSMLGGVSSAPSYITPSQAGNIGSVQSGLMTSMLGGVSSAPSYTTPQAGNLGSVQSGLMTSMLGGVSSAPSYISPSQAGNLSENAVVSGLPTTSVLCSLSSKAGIAGNPTVTSLTQPISSAFSIPAALSATSSALGASGGFSFTSPVDKSVTNAAQTLFAASSPVSSSQATTSMGSSFFGAAAVTSLKSATSLGSSLPAGTTQMNSGNTGQGFSFGNTVESNINPSGFSIAAPTSSSTSVFGSSGGQMAAPTSSSTSVFGSSGGQMAAPTSSSTSVFGSSGGQMAASTSSSTSVFGSSGGQTVTKSGKESIKVNLFGATPATTSSSTGLFSFGQTGVAGQVSAVQSQPSALQRQPSTASMSATPMSASDFNFSSVTQSAVNKPAETFSLSGQPSSNQNSMFNFGAGSSSSGNSFGTFGSSAPTTVSTGSVSGGPAAFSFGNGSTGQQKFGFNAATTTAPTFAFTQASKTEPNAQASSVFGMSNQNMAFGSSQQKSAVPVFGGSSTTPAFGNSTVAAFGSTGEKKSVPSGFNFGVGQTAFGAASQTAAPAFGSVQNPTPVFGASQTTAAFGTSQTSSAFGTSQTPAFGTSSTPASGFGSSQTTPSFGSPATTVFGSAAGNPGTFQFGQSSSQPNTEKGFNFSANAAPVFNFGSASTNTPNQNNLFNVNTNSGVPTKPRVLLNRTKRRGMKK